jgi:hypothetical protein
MAKMNTKNTWGSAATQGGTGIDQQRADLFRISLTLPPSLGGNGVWDEQVQFAVESFPFPEMKVQTFDTKYLNQTNHQIGGDSASSEIAIPVRYAFSQQSAQVLYKWMYLISNPVTGGTGLTSAVKCNGEFRWLVPDMAKQIANANSLGGTDASDTLKTGLIYKLEGCFITGLKPTDADMKSANTAVNLGFTLMVDRYYPIGPSGLIVTN